MEPVHLQPAEEAVNGHDNLDFNPMDLLTLEPTPGFKLNSIVAGAHGSSTPDRDGLQKNRTQHRYNSLLSKVGLVETPGANRCWLPCVHRGRNCRVAVH